ncbi:MAG: hypothetical protein CM15mP46_1620 [Alphaproteobacteria bacterium]|nr:MAG: hypothetical protein CM15mP46_1620 [Alphaproteobacteria bacterium]
MAPPFTMRQMLEAGGFWGKTRRGPQKWNTFWGEKNPILDLQQLCHFQQAYRR